MKTPAEGTETIINCAINPDYFGISGKYFKDCKEGYSTSTAK